MENYYSETDDYDEVDAIQVIDFNKWRQLHMDDEYNLCLGMGMTSLGTLILLVSESKFNKCTFLIEKSMNQLTIQDDADENDATLQRLSLAHERLHNMPKILLEQVASDVKILDISHNEFDKLDFLDLFPQLTTLICDHNNINSECYLPYLPKLELLWINHCKILDIYPWIYKLSISCPNLRYLSLMSNPGAPFSLYGGNVKERTHYRLFILSLFPKLLHVDNKPVNNDERKKSRKLYQKHVIDILTTKVQQNLPDCVRRASRRMSMMVSTENLTNLQKKNYIV